MRILMVGECVEISVLLEEGLEFEIQTKAKCDIHSIEQFLRLESYDVVFVSIEKLSESELKLCERIRHLSKNLDAFIVLVCSQFQEEFLKRAYAIGVDEYLVTPASIDNLSLLISLITRVQNSGLNSDLWKTRLAA